MPPTPGPDASDIGAGAAIQTPEPHAGAATAQKTAPQDMADREAFQMVIGECQRAWRSCDCLHVGLITQRHATSSPCS